MQTRSQKEELVKGIAARTKESKALVFASYKGVPVKDLDVIRGALRKSGSAFQIMKKTLLSIALKDAGISVDGRALPGEIGVAFSSDEVAAAKAIADFLKANKESTLAIEGGALEGKVLTAAEVKALAKLPTRDELRAQLVGTLQAPISGFVRTLSGNLTSLVQVLRAVSEKKA
jgi:large subunit ribosomal protein L10